MHPSLKAGSNRDGIIYWAERHDFPHYNTIYIWHEILHSYIKRSDLGHAVIELITDEEMRRRFNDIDYPPFIGHDDLLPLKEKILIDWRRYLNSENKDIQTFIEREKQLLDL